MAPNKSMRRLLAIPYSSTSLIEVWLNNRRELVITRKRKGQPAPITLKIYQESGDPEIPLKPVKIRSKGSVIIKR